MKPSPKQRKPDRIQKNINQILYKTYIYIVLKNGNPQPKKSSFSLKVKVKPLKDY
jgi:hypothetical protein